jgi:hypothetical protein
MIDNPIYGGAYAYGKTRVSTGYDVSGVRVKKGRKPRGEWLALMPGTHEGYVDWERAEAIRRMVSDNVPTSRHHGAPKHGDALLAGLVRCRRCGQKLTVRYTGMKHNIPRYSCHRGRLDNGEPRCIAFGGLRVDDAIEAAVLKVVEPGAIEAAVVAEAELSHHAIRSAKHSDAILNRRVMRRIVPSVNMTPLIPPTVLSPVNLRRAGTRRSPASPKSRRRLPTMTRSRHREWIHHRSASPHWSTISGPYGWLRRLMRGSRSVLSAP